MSGDAFRRARPGAEMKIAAAAWNACLDAAEAHKRGPGGGQPIEQYRQADIVLCRNTSGADVARFGVLGVAGVIITPTDNLDSFQSQVAVTGTTPTNAHRGKFVVCLEPIAANAIGRAWISGVCQVQVNVTDASHTHCDVNPSSTAALRSDASGSARILYRATAGTGTGWCVVRLGDAEAGLRIGKTTSTWTKGTTASITLYEGGAFATPSAGGGSIDNVVNLWGDVEADKWVGITGGFRGAYYLVVAEC